MSQTNPADAISLNDLVLLREGLEVFLDMYEDMVRDLDPLYGELKTEQEWNHPQFNLNPLVQFRRRMAALKEHATTMSNKMLSAIPKEELYS
mgnify:CR=1 FL=1